VGKCGRIIEATGDDIICNMRCACWIDKDTDAYSEYVIFIIFSRQQWLRQCASVLYIYNLSPPLWYFCMYIGSHAKNV